MSAPVVSLLAELVAIDSTSTRSNLPVIELLERRLAPLGFKLERHTYASEDRVPKANLIATLGDGVPELALVGHTDCVPFDAAWTEALTLTERDGKLYGRGSCDTKGFIACAVTAAVAVHQKLSRPLMLLFTADEELGCIGAKKLVEAGAGGCKRAIIGEPTSLRPIRANKGYCLSEVEVRGKEGHSAYPDSGTSAIFHAARLLTRLEAYSLGKLRDERDDGFSPPFATLNVGRIEGGKAKNIIPGRCTFTLEWRPLPGQPVHQVLREVERLKDVCAGEDPAFSATISPLRTDTGYDTAADADVVAFIEAKTGKKNDTVAFGTEGPQLAALGAVPVVFGPGDITVAHQTGEYVPVADLHAVTAVLEAAALHFCGGRA